MTATKIAALVTLLTPVFAVDSLPYHPLPHAVHINMSINALEPNKLEYTHIQEVFKDSVVYFHVPRVSPTHQSYGENCQIKPEDFEFQEVFGSDLIRHVPFENVEVGQYNCVFHIEFPYPGRFKFTVRSKFHFHIEVLPSAWREWERIGNRSRSVPYALWKDVIPPGGTADAEKKKAALEKIREIFSPREVHPGRVLGFINLLDYQPKDKPFKESEYRKSVEFVIDFVWHFASHPNITSDDVFLTIRNNPAADYLTSAEAILRTQPSRTKISSYEVQGEKCHHSALGGRVIFLDPPPPKPEKKPDGDAGKNNEEQKPGRRRLLDDKELDCEVKDKDINQLDEMFLDLCDFVVLFTGTDKNEDVVKKLYGKVPEKAKLLVVEMFDNSVVTDEKATVIKMAPPPGEGKPDDKDQKKFNLLASDSETLDQAAAAFARDAFEKSFLTKEIHPFLRIAVGLDELRAQLMFYLNLNEKKDAFVLERPVLKQPNSKDVWPLAKDGIFAADEVSVAMHPNITGGVRNLRFSIHRLLESDVHSKWLLHPQFHAGGQWVRAPEGTWHVCVEYSDGGEKTPNFEHQCSDYFLNIGGGVPSLRGKLRELDSSKILDNVAYLWRGLVEKIKNRYRDLAQLQQSETDLTEKVELQKKWMDSRQRNIEDFYHVANIANTNLQRAKVLEESIERVLPQLDLRYKELGADRSRLDHIVSQFNTFEVHEHEMDQNSIYSELAKLDAHVDSLHDSLSVNEGTYVSSAEAAKLLRDATTKALFPRVAMSIKGDPNIPLASTRKEDREGKVTYKHIPHKNEDGDDEQFASMEAEGTLKFKPSKKAEKKTG